MIISMYHPKHLKAQNNLFQFSFSLDQSVKYWSVRLGFFRQEPLRTAPEIVQKALGLDHAAAEEASNEASFSCSENRMITSFHVNILGLYGIVFGHIWTCNIIYVWNMDEYWKHIQYVYACMLICINVIWYAIYIYIIQIYLCMHPDVWLLDSFLFQGEQA